MATGDTMGRRKADDFDNDRSDYFDEYGFDESEEEEGFMQEQDGDFEAEVSLLDEVSISDIINEYGIDEFADAVIDSISYSDLEKLRDRITEYLE
jgi:hypothetical protein